MMHYFGGKARIGKRLATFINQFDGSYWEPFCGVFSVGRHVDLWPKVASDAHHDLICLLTALKHGWKPPTTLTESEYNALKKQSPSALRGFAGFGCSHSGKFFGGYARDNTGRNYAKNAHNSLNKLRPALIDTQLILGTYDRVKVSADVIYCDPPYANTTGFSTGKFDHEKFWQWVRDRSERSIVLVSEYNAPTDFLPVWQAKVRTDMRGANQDRVEKLFLHESLTHAVNPVYYK